MTKWISILDRLPDNNINVLVVNAVGKCLDEREPVIAYCEDGEWVSVAWWNFNQYGNPKVTHWMPLPKLFD